MSGRTLDHTLHDASHWAQDHTPGYILRNQAESNRSSLKGPLNNACQGITCYPENLITTGLVVSACVAVVGSVVNLASVLVILTSSLRRSTNSLLVCQLNLLELIYCSCLLPIQTANYYYRHAAISRSACQIYGSFLFWIDASDWLIISNIAFYRLLLVVYTKIFIKYSKWHWLLASCVACYFLPLALFVVPIFCQEFKYFDFDQNLLRCWFDFDKASPINLLPISAIVLFSTTVVLTCYIRILVFTKNQKQLRTTSVSPRKAKARKQAAKITGMVTLTIMCFTLSTVPFYLVIVLDISMNYPLVHIWAQMVRWTVVILNPFVYSLMDAKFQYTCLRRFYKLLGRKSASNNVYVKGAQTSSRLKGRYMRERIPSMLEEPRLSLPSLAKPSLTEPSANKPIT